MSACIHHAVRTPFGRLGVGLARERPDDLPAHVVTATLERVPGRGPAAIKEVVGGNPNDAAEENRNAARIVVNAGGGTITPGDPLGASDGPILGTLAVRPQEGGERRGLAARCVGGVPGLAVVLGNEEAA
jgi:acetyl-CoA acetyltransferase